MVVMGSARAPGEGRPVCSVAWARQCVHQQHQNTRTGIKMAAHSGESLPVVELKPFTKKTWSREKSLPNFYDKQPVKEESGSESSKKSGPEPSPNIVRYIKELSEQRKTVDTRQSVDHTQRYRSKLHPKADFTLDGRVASEHQQDLIPSFITRQERTKTTLGANHGEDNVSPATATPGTAQLANTGYEAPPGTATSINTTAGELSNLMSAYARDKQLNSESVCVKGGKLSLGSVTRRPLLYLKPFSAYRQKPPWTVCREENSPCQPVSPRNAFSLSLSRGSAGLTASANGAAGRRNLVLSGSNFRAQDHMSLQPLRVTHSPHKFSNKLGAARESHTLLGRSGAPTVLEKNLSYDLELRMERCRRERSFASVAETNVLSTAHYVAYDSQPTRGELTLMRAREANKSRDGRTTYRRNGLQKPLAVNQAHQAWHVGRGYQADGPAHHNSPNNLHFMLARAPDNVSPRSRSDQDDSGIHSSAGDAVDDVPRLGDFRVANGVVILPRDIGEEVIMEQPGDCDEHYDEGGNEQERREQAQLLQGERRVLVPTDSVSNDAQELRKDDQPHSVEGRADRRVVDENQNVATIPDISQDSARLKQSNERPKSENSGVRLKQNYGQSGTSGIPQTGNALAKNNAKSTDLAEQGNSESVKSTVPPVGLADSDDVDATSQPLNSVRNQESNREQGQLDTTTTNKGKEIKLNLEPESVSEQANAGISEAGAGVARGSEEVKSKERAFESRQLPADTKDSEPVANDIDLESLNSTDRSSRVDSSRPEFASGSAQHTGGEMRTEKVFHFRSDTQVQLADGSIGGASGAETAGAHSEGSINTTDSVHGHNSIDTGNSAGKDAGSERKPSQVGNQVTSAEGREKSVEPSGQMENVHASVQEGSATTSSGDSGEQPAASSTQDNGVSEDQPHGQKAQPGQNIDHASSAVPSAEHVSAEAKSEQKLKTESDTGVNVAADSTDTGPVDSRTDAPSADEDPHGSAATFKDTGDGFEGEKTFLTTTNVEVEDWQNAVTV